MKPNIWFIYSFFIDFFACDDQYLLGNIDRTALWLFKTRISHFACGGIGWSIDSKLSSLPSTKAVAIVLRISDTRGAARNRLTRVYSLRLCLIDHRHHPHICFSAKQQECT